MSPATISSPRCGRQPELSHRAGILIFCAVCACLYAVGCGSGSSTSVQNPQLTFTTIDAPGAGTQAGQGTSITDINAAGEMVGNARDSAGAFHAFSRGSDGTFTMIDVPGASSQSGFGTSALSVDGAGDILLLAHNSATDFSGYIWTPNGAFTAIDAPNSTTTNSIRMNESGVVVGAFQDSAGVHGFLRTTDGSFTQFDVPGSFNTPIIDPRDVNSAGVVVGSFTSFSDNNFMIVRHGFIRGSDGSFTVIDDPNAGTASGAGTEVESVNTSGEITGVALINPGPNFESFLASAAGSLTVFAPPAAGSNGSFSVGLNDSGAIVGSYLDTNYVEHGFLRSPNGGFTIIDDPDAAHVPGVQPNPWGSFGTRPSRISATGAIVGTYMDSMGVHHGFLRQ